jgi:hypothetical protein
MEELCFCVVRAERFGIYSVEREFCTGVCEERTLAGGRGIAIVGADTRKRLVTD